MGGIGPHDHRILVTGGAGFIGSHLTDALVDDNEVIVYDSLVNGTRTNIPSDATFVRADIRDTGQLESAMTDVDLVFHQAAMINVTRTIEDPTKSHEINAEATLTLLEAARRHDVPVVLASSAAVYGKPDSLPVRETQQARPVSPYGLDKLMVDHYARLYHQHYGLETVALRYFNVYGPRQHAGVVAAFRAQAMSDDPVTIEGDGSQTRDFVHVHDVVDANLRAATTDAASGTVLNVGTGQETPIRRLADRIVTITGATSDIVHIEERPEDIQRSVADISRTKSVLGYDPTVGLTDGLRQLCRVEPETSEPR